MQHRLVKLLAAIASLWFGASAGPTHAQQDDPLPFRFGDYRHAISDLQNPTGVAIDHAGRIYIVESAAHRVSIYDRQGQPLRQWGAFGRGPGQFAFPTAIAVIGQGDDAQVLVTDTGNDRVQVFAATGRFIRSWGGRGVDPGRFRAPTGIAIDNDLVLIADTGNHRVQLLNHDGTVINVLALDDEDGPSLARPADVAFDAQRNIYLTNADRNRIQSYSLDGTFIEAWGDYGPFAGLMDEPLSLAVRDRRVFVADTRNHRVQVFTLDGRPVYQWGVHARLPREGQGALHYPADLAIAPDGSFAAIAEPFEDRVQVFAVAGTDVAEADAGTPFQPRPNQTHFGTRVSLAGNLLAIAEPETHSVYLYRIDREVPVHVTTHTGRGRAAHQFVRIADLELAVDPVTLFVADTAMHRLQQFAIDYDRTEELAFRPLITNLTRALDLAYIRDTLSDADVHWPIEPVAVERGPDGNLYIVDAGNAAVHVFDDSMTRRRTIGSAAGPGRLHRPNDIAFSADGSRIAVVDSGDRNVKIYDARGSFISAFDASDAVTGPFIEPFGIEWGVDDHLYITDAAAHRITRCNSQGTVVAQWGEKGSDDGQLWKPGGIEQADDGRLFVADYGNHRVQIFSPDGQWQVSFGLGKPMTRELKQRQAAEEQASQ